MADTLADGTVLQDGLRFNARKAYPADAVRYIPYPVIGQITAVIPANSPDNNNAETYLCDIHVTELGIDLMQVPWTLEKAGPDNYVHVGPVAASSNLDYTPFNTQFLKPKVSNGDTVIVVFAFGDVHKPYIIKMLPHNQSGPLGMSPDPRPSGLDDVYKVRFNGTNFYIDADGNLTFETTPTLDPEIEQEKIFKINWKNSAGEANVLTLDMTAGAEAISLDHASGSFIHMESDGSIDMQSSFGDEVAVSPTDGVTISTPAGGGAQATFKNGAVGITAAEDITVKSTGGNVNLMAATGTIEFQATASAIKFVASGGAELNLAGAKVALGAGGNETISLLYQFATALATATAPGFGAPLSSNPTVAELLPMIMAIMGTL